MHFFLVGNVQRAGGPKRQRGEQERAAASKRLLPRMSIRICPNAGPTTGLAGLPQKWELYRECRSCELPTGKWCDSCEEAGVITREEREGTIAGTPHCSQYERDDVQGTVRGI